MSDDFPRIERPNEQFASIYRPGSISSSRQSLTKKKGPQAYPQIGSLRWRSSAAWAALALLGYVVQLGWGDQPFQFLRIAQSRKVVREWNRRRERLPSCYTSLETREGKPKKNNTKNKQTPRKRERQSSLT